MASSAASPPATTPVANLEVKPVLSRQPSLCMKPAQALPATSPASIAPSAPLTLTSKEWVIPPRPKPGRKPATDTPPTKRKAQNRAAQRAFRERRAARVGELEEQLKQIEDENELDQEVLRAKISDLEKEIEQYTTDIAHWVDRCQKLESELATLKSTSAASSRPSGGASSHIIHATPDDSASNDNTVGCGNCTLETRCQCIDDAFTAMGGEPATSSHQHDKRPHSPVQNPGEKRIKLEPEDSLEIDFTAIYASKPPPTSRPEARSPTSAVADPCGFCSDGTPCICAEMAADQEAQNSQSAAEVSLNRRGAMRQLNQFTPPPSEGDVSISLPTTTDALPSSCASGPGTCAQCRADPKSTLFCKTLAASRAQSGSSSVPVGCCGGQNAAGGCCQSQAPAQTGSVPLPSRTTRSRTAASTSTRPSLPPKTSSGVTLTCADAYTTLSRHPAYERASGEIATWLPQLHANDVSLPTAGRPALEIDAANVMAVLKDFDRRFGQNR